MRKSPKVAAVTNVTPTIWTTTSDMQEYIDAKRNILLWQEPPLPRCAGGMRTISPAGGCRPQGEQFWFTRLHETDHGAFPAPRAMIPSAMPPKMALDPRAARAECAKLRGLHNVENLLAAIAAVWGPRSGEAMRQVGSTFTGVEHRIEPVRVLGRCDLLQ